MSRGGHNAALYKHLLPCRSACIGLPAAPCAPRRVIPNRVFVGGIAAPSAARTPAFCARGARACFHRTGIVGDIARQRISHALCIGVMFSQRFRAPAPALVLSSVTAQRYQRARRAALVRGDRRGGNGRRTVVFVWRGAFTASKRLERGGSVRVL